MSVQVTELKVGHCTHPQCMALKGAPWGPRAFPARAYLLQSEQGTWLWDTGYAAHFFEHARGLYRLYSLTTPVTLPTQEHLLPQLARHGVAVSGLSGVVLSHFHADHVAGVADLPGVPVWASAQAWSSLEAVSGTQALLRGQIPALVPAAVRARARRVEDLPQVSLPLALTNLARFAQEVAPLQDRVAPLRTGWELAPGMVVVALPGHARGHLGLFVHERGDPQDARSWSLLASDAAWGPEAFSDPAGVRGPSELSFLIQHDRQQYYQTLGLLHALHHGGVRVRLSHEPWPGERGAVHA